MNKTSSQLHELPDGARGTLATLKFMRALVKKSKRSHVVRSKVLALTADLVQKDYLSEMRRVHAFVRDSIRYVRDIRNVETLQTPEKTLEIRQGDCDDKSTLVAAMLEVIGHPTRFVAMGFRGKPFCHVYVETKIGARWVGVETTEPVDFGWHPPGMTSRMVVYN